MKPTLLKSLLETIPLLITFATLVTRGSDTRVNTDVLTGMWSSSPVSDIDAGADLSPTALAATVDGRVLFVACATANRVILFDIPGGRIAEQVRVPESPLGLAISKDGSRLYVACAGPSSSVCIVDVPQRRVISQIPAGHTAMAPVLSQDEQKLYVCNRFNNDISVIDLAAGREVQRIPVEREPVAAALTPDGQFLVVANHLHTGAANHHRVAAVVSVIDTCAGRVIRSIPLPEGSGLLRGVAISPDGRFAAVTHLRSLYWQTTSHVELGGINCNALSVLDMKNLCHLGTLLLDQSGRGAANPWAVTWTADGETIVVSHAGTHEVSLIDAPDVADPSSFLSLRLSEYAKDDVRFPKTQPKRVRVRQRIALPGDGPRALAMVGAEVYVANYFSDNLCRINLAGPGLAAELLPLRSAGPTSVVRQGEMLFNDARLCLQGWQSCASCHDCDARTDALHWDLLNDGAGNPKKTKSLVWAHQTAPAMALGVRANAEVAVRAGIHHILFTEQPEAVPAAIDAYLNSLRPVPSPQLNNGGLSAAGERGRQLFMSARTGCADCHPPGLFTDLATHDVGTAAVYRGLWAGGADKATDLFDTPALVELWRTAPYLHDASAATLRDMLTAKNPHGLHGRTSHLAEQELGDLIEYLLSL